MKHPAIRCVTMAKSRIRGSRKVSHYCFSIITSEGPDVYLTAEKDRLLGMWRVEMDDGFVVSLTPTLEAFRDKALSGAFNKALGINVEV